MKKLLLILLCVPLMYSCGNKDIGCVSGDCISGEGVRVLSNGNKYVGEYRNGKKNGEGICWRDGTKYTGEWKHGRMDGLGIKTWVNGDKYSGQWKNDNMHGLGIMTYGNGRVSNGLWQNGEFLGED